MFFQSVLHVNLAGPFAGKRGDEREFVAQGFLVLLPFVTVKEVFRLLPTSEEEEGAADVLSCFGLGSAFLDERAEGCNAGTGSDHDDGFGGVGRELEVRVADVYGDVNAIVLVAWTGDFVGKTVGIRRGIAVLLLLER